MTGIFLAFAFWSLLIAGAAAWLWQYLTGAAVKALTGLQRDTHRDAGEWLGLAPMAGRDTSHRGKE